MCFVKILKCTAYWLINKKQTYCTFLCFVEIILQRCCRVLLPWVFVSVCEQTSINFMTWCQFLQIIQAPYGKELTRRAMSVWTKCHGNQSNSCRGCVKGSPSRHRGYQRSISIRWDISLNAKRSTCCWCWSQSQRDLSSGDQECLSKISRQSFQYHG